MKELIIIGGGAAGITAGIYAARKYIDTCLIARDFTGQIGISSWVENYPGFKRVSGLELVRKFKEHLEISGNIEIKPFESVRKIEPAENGYRVVTDENSHEAKALIIASGGIPKKIKAANEEKFLGKGVSYCVTCDETAYKGRTVAVVGGGNAGAEAAIELARFCVQVHLLESQDELSADKILQAEMARTGKINIIVSAEIKSFSGRGHLEKIIYLDKKKKEKEISAAGCFVEIGAAANTEFARGFVDLNEEGEIKVDPLTLEASVPGVFAAGDANDLPGKQIVIACGQGALSVLSVSKYLAKLAQGNYD